jgi:histone deacetylase complex regulatory component SIN3
MYNFQQQIESNHDLLTEKVNLLEKELEQSQNEIDMSVQDLVDYKLGKLQNNLTQAMGDISETFNRNSSEVIELFISKIEDDLKSPLELELSKYLEKIGSIVRLSEININQDKIADKFNSIDDLSNDIVDLVEQINEAKISLGIDN